MHKYLAWTVLSTALLSSGVASADQITIINKVNSNKCRLDWGVTRASEAVTKSQMAHLLPKGFDLATNSAPQVIQIPSIPAIRITGILIECNANMGPVRMYSNTTPTPIRAGKTYVLQRGQEHLEFVENHFGGGWWQGWIDIDIKEV